MLMVGQTPGTSVLKSIEVDQWRTKGGGPPRAAGPEGPPNV